MMTNNIEQMIEVMEEKTYGFSSRLCDNNKDELIEEMTSLKENAKNLKRIMKQSLKNLKNEEVKRI